MTIASGLARSTYLEPYLLYTRFICWGHHRDMELDSPERKSKCKRKILLTSEKWSIVNKTNPDTSIKQDQPIQLPLHQKTLNLIQNAKSLIISNYPSQHKIGLFQPNSSGRMARWLVHMEWYKINRDNVTNQYACHARYKSIFCKKL